VSRWRRFTVADASIAGALMVLLIAMLLPTLRARSFERAVDDASADVETLRVAATRSFRATGRWPQGAELGVIPTELAGAFQGDTLLVRDAYAVQWRLWARIDHVPEPPRPSAPDADAPPDTVQPGTVPVVRGLPAVVVHSTDASLLAELVRRYGSTSSFARDSSWTLVLDEPTR